MFCNSKWGRLHGKISHEFEKEYAKLQGAEYGLAVSSGTGALSTILGVMDIGPGDEIIIPVYTFVATYNVITLNYALPIFVDTDVETFQIDATKIEEAITKQTKVLMPVHIGGSPFDADRVTNIDDNTISLLLKMPVRRTWQRGKGKESARTVWLVHLVFSQQKILIVQKAELL